MWDAKVTGEDYARILPRVKPQASELVAQYQATHELIISNVKNTLTRLNIESHLQHEYVWYAQRLWKLAQTYKGKALQREADALYLWYLARGRNEVALRAIAASMGIKISSTEDIVGDVLAPVLIKEVGRGTIVTDGSEQTVFEYVGAISTISGYIDLSNMEDEDVIIIRSYVKLGPDRDYVLYDSETFTGRQAEPALHLLPRLSGYAMKITIQQTEGTYKSFDYLFVKGV